MTAYQSKDQKDMRTKTSLKQMLISTAIPDWIFNHNILKQLMLCHSSVRSPQIKWCEFIAVLCE